MLSHVYIVYIAELTDYWLQLYTLCKCVMWLWYRIPATSQSKQLFWSRNDVPCAAVKGYTGTYSCMCACTLYWAMATTPICINAFTLWNATHYAYIYVYVFACTWRYMIISVWYYRVVGVHCVRQVFMGILVLWSYSLKLGLISIRFARLAESDMHVKVHVCLW